MQIQILKKKFIVINISKLQNQKLPTEVIVFKIQNPKYFCILIFFFCFYVQRATTVLCFKKIITGIFFYMFFKKTFQVFFFYLNSTKCNCGLLIKTILQRTLNPIIIIRADGTILGAPTLKYNEI